MSPHALFLVRMDVAHDLEPTFNDVYDKEHLPLLHGVPLRTRTAGAAGPPGRLRGGPAAPADVPALERHLRHRPLEARGAAVHVQQEVHRGSAHLILARNGRM